MSKNIHRGNKTKIVFSIVFVIIISIISMIGYELFDRSRYIKLSIPSPISYTTFGDWYYTEFSKRKYSDSNDLYFIWRRETRAFGTHLGYDFSSWNNVVLYFDDFLRQYGWVKIYNDEFAPCVVALHENESLHQGDGGYIAYRRDNTRSSVIEPTVCLAVLDITYDPDEPRFKVVLSSANPSTLTRIRSAAD